MGLTLENLSEEELCDLMCGKLEEEIYNEEDDKECNISRNDTGTFQQILQSNERSE